MRGQALLAARKAVPAPAVGGPVPPTDASEMIGEWTSATLCLSVTPQSRLLSASQPLVLRRYEVVRSIAVEIDNELREAFNESLRDDLRPTERLDAVDERLIRAELRTGALPPRDRERVDGQIRVANEVVMHLFSLSNEPHALPQAHLQAAISAVREVIGPLQLPPPLFYRRAGRPRRCQRSSPWPQCAEN